MNFYRDNKPVKLTLKSDRRRTIKQGFPWIYAGELEELPTAESGSLAFLRTRAGEILASGFYCPNSPLSFRVLAVAPSRITQDSVAERINQAIEFRNLHFDQLTTGYRLINGEGDLLPGLIIDRYNDIFVIQFDGSASSKFWNLDKIAAHLKGKFNVAAIYYKPQARTKDTARLVYGDCDLSSVEFLENGITFIANLTAGQKTGFFFDQRQNRKLVESLSAKKSVLNLFSYTGGFSVYAGKGGAVKVCSVDSSPGASELCKKNWAVAKLKVDHEVLVMDVFEFLAHHPPTKWDIVIVDPPSFAHASSQTENAAKSYEKLLGAALNVTNAGGLFAASSCSSQIGHDEFLSICQRSFQAQKRRAYVLGLYGQPCDHPYPLACSELRYLKFFLFKVD